MSTDDELSILILKTISQEHLGPTAGQLPPSLELRSTLASVFGSPAPRTGSEGDLARAALDLLRQDPAFAESIQLATIEAATPESPPRYLDPLTVSLITAALLVLQTRVTFTLDSSRKWAIKIDKKSSSDAAVKLLVQRLLPFLGK